MRRFWMVGAAFGLLALGMTAPAAAQPSRFDPKARAMLDAMLAAYKALPALHEKLVLTTTATPPELLPGKPERAFELRYQKPNRFYLLTTGTQNGKTKRRLVVSDGVSLWRWDSATNLYTQEKAPARLAEIQNMPDDSPETDILFRGKDPFLDFSPPNTLFTPGKPERVGDVEMDTIQADLSQADTAFKGAMRLYLGPKDRLIHGLVIEGNGKAPGTDREMSFRMEMRYTLVNPAPVFTPADFRFTPPPGAKRKPASPKSRPSR